MTEAPRNCWHTVSAMVHPEVSQQWSNCTTFLFTEAPSNNPTATLCYMENKEPAQQHKGINANSNQQREAEVACKKQCGSRDTKPNHTTIHCHKRSNNPTHSQIIDKSSKATHISSMYTGMHLHAPGHQGPRPQGFCTHTQGPVVGGRDKS